MLAMRIVHRARCGSFSHWIGWSARPTVAEQLVDGSAFGLEQEPEDDPGHDQRQEPGDDDERARERPPREPEAEQQGESKADDELADERPDGELERVDDCRPARGVVEDEAVVVEPGERRGEVGDRRGRRPLEAQHHVVDDGQGEREEQVRNRRRQEEPARELLLPPRRAASRGRGGGGRETRSAGGCCRRCSARLGRRFLLSRSLPDRHRYVAAPGDSLPLRDSSCKPPLSRGPVAPIASPVSASKKWSRWTSTASAIRSPTATANARVDPRDTLRRGRTRDIPGRVRRSRDLRVHAPPLFRTVLASVEKWTSDSLPRASTSSTRAASVVSRSASLALGHGQVLGTDTRPRACEPRRRRGRGDAVRDRREGRAAAIRARARAHPRAPRSRPRTGSSAASR